MIYSSKVVISLYGGTGKVGQEIEKILLSHSLCVLYKLLSSKSNKNEIEDACNKSDIVIDFSQANAIDVLLDSALKFRTKLVIGTTGYSNVQYKKIIDASKEIPIFYSENMSLGIYMLGNIINYLDSKLPKETISNITESHHQNKIDMPSGTSLMLQKLFNRIEKPEIKSIRLDNISGNHKVYFKFGEELITISHNAGSRKIYAENALEAALFLNNINKAGIYNMDNIVN